MEQGIKQLLEEQRKIFSEDVKRHIGALVEDFDSKIELIAEQHKSIMEVLREHTRQISEMKDQIMQMNVQISAINKQLTEMNMRLGHVEDNLRRKVDYEDFEKLEKRVALLEAR